MGSIPVGDSDFFFVPRSWQTEYSIFPKVITLTNQQQAQTTQWTNHNLKELQVSGIKRMKTRASK